MLMTVIRIAAKDEKKRKRLFRKNKIEFLEINARTTDESFIEVFLVQIENKRKLNILEVISSIEDAKFFLEQESNHLMRVRQLRELYERYESLKERMDIIGNRYHNLNQYPDYLSILDNLKEADEEFSFITKLLCSTEEYEKIRQGEFIEKEVCILVSSRIAEKIKNKSYKIPLDRMLSIREETSADIRNHMMSEYWKNASDEIKQIFTDGKNELRKIVKEMKTDIREEKKKTKRTNGDDLNTIET
ncbi:hypothetical protein LCGC14_2660940, partial [marine sediment metagenome]